MRIEIDEWASQKKSVFEAAGVLRDGGVIAMPTDSGYALVCDLHARKGIDRLYSLKDTPKSHPLSIIVDDPDSVGKYTGYVSTLAYRTMKRLLPGPYTFILEAGKEIPKRMHKKRSTIGIRVPMAEIPRRIAEGLGRPLVSTSVRGDLDGDHPEERFVIDPVEIEQVYGPRLDAVVDGGLGLEQPTTVVDLTVQPFELLREGLGDISFFQA